LHIEALSKKTSNLTPIFYSAYTGFLDKVKNLQTWHDINQPICFVIGGPEGLSDAFLNQADVVWSLSDLTLPHPLVRVVL